MAARRALPQRAEDSPRAWRLRALPVCASSEVELERWLAAPALACLPALATPLAVVARRQRFGRGQRGRVWLSPAGGAWISAALPWPPDPTAAAAPGLAVAVGLTTQQVVWVALPYCPFKDSLVVTVYKAQAAHLVVAVARDLLVLWLLLILVVTEALESLAV